MSKLIAIINGEGFVSRIEEAADFCVTFTGDADIDADGANGQQGSRPAYTSDNNGSEDLANGGMGIRGGRVVGVSDWFKDIVILGPDGQPKVFPRGIIASRTAYRFKGIPTDDPNAYLNSEAISYMVVPPIIIQKTAGAVLGCRCRVTNTQNGCVSDGIVGDVGPRSKVGEVSIQMARDLRINESPRHGGTSEQIIKYEIWPGKASKYGWMRLRSNGQYVE